MAYIIKRTENIEGVDTVYYMQQSGFFGSKETARVFDNIDDAEWIIETEKDDPKYDRSYMGACTFEIEMIEDVPRTWYAILTDEEDNDWGTGSFDFEEAKSRCREYGPDARIAVINDGPDPICEQIILQEDF